MTLTSVNKLNKFQFIIRRDQLLYSRCNVCSFQFHVNGFCNITRAWREVETNTSKTQRMKQQEKRLYYPYSDFSSIFYCQDISPSTFRCVVKLEPEKRIEETQPSNILL